MEPGTELFAQLMGAAVMGGITSGVAVHKGRSAVGWFFVGFLTGCIGLIIVSCLPNARDQNAKLSSIELEARKLREQLKHERLRNESFQHHVRTRIDAHDAVLGVNTRGLGAGRAPPGAIGGVVSAPALGPGSAAAPPADPPLYPTAPAPAADPFAPAPAPAAADPFSHLEWYVKFGERRSQPLTFEKLKKFWEIGNLTPDTLVASGQDETWMPVSEIPGLLARLERQCQT